MSREDDLERLRRARIPKEKKVPKPIAKKSAKTISKEAAERERLGGSDSDLVKWYKSKMKISSGLCSECGLKVETNIYKFAINTICHILAKRDSVCPSVKYHPLNFIILCEHHHDLFDKSSWDEREKWGCWKAIRERLIMVYPNLALEERRFFPESVIHYINNKSPFSENI